MCEASAYLVKADGEELLMEGVELLEKGKNGTLTLVDLFGEKKEVKGTVKVLSLVEHKILIESKA